ncbi:MAG: enoyl-CoA hydratase family protein [Deltaproteobacteria bacterium]|nr:enoyl-CoA hydratase family protein [Deltaproteobacteria bacterium]NNK08680.1 enoyl-CoA hydratase family protein [Myxococcales bacterium]MBT8463599.1 enoyl-CoA hydratase family protein [Deltaproteobacteria bacterium]MBT8481380.1 enoyl-CoA hydratase family protein [Deltaproteobacteria bacterium]NNK43280.1 enoyl-CoA hydratase family protein [Myxococcales bacterium]
MGISYGIIDGIAEIVVDYPPVNAVPVAGWFELAERITEAGNDPETRAVILRAEGRGFNAGVDIKEMQETEGFDALLGANRGCWESFKAVYECKVPVITAVHGYCVGGGIGLAGNSDILIAATGTRFALPEVDRGALGAATHLARLVPALKMRAMVLTCEPATAEELHSWGSVYALVEADQLAEKARDVARAFTKKIPRVVRAAKECLNNIDPVDVNRSYRFEQGFTFELNLAGVADEARDAFVDKRDPVTDKK